MQSLILNVQHEVTAMVRKEEQKKELEAKNTYQKGFDLIAGEDSESNAVGKI